MVQRNDFYCNVYRYGDRCDSQFDGNGIWYTVQKGKDTA